MEREQRNGATARPEGAVAIMQNANYMQTICDVCKEPMSLNYDEVCPRKSDTMWCHRKCLKPEEQGTAPMLEAAKAAVNDHSALVGKALELAKMLRSLKVRPYGFDSVYVEAQVSAPKWDKIELILDELLRALGDGR